MESLEEKEFQEKLASHKICSICFNTYTEFGNNASPINTGTCCNVCNDLVIIARLNSRRVAKIINNQ